jgi:hypothetical protein
MTNLRAFVAESNRIEGIFREPTTYEIEGTKAFLALPPAKLTIARMVELVKVYQPDACLRDKPGLDVRIGHYRPPQGGSHISDSLNRSLYNARFGLESPQRIHWRYEALHPFTDGNGRSGRALWLWCMGGETPLGFLHTWYYQSLADGR